MRAIVADDHALVREGLVAFFHTVQPDWDIEQATTLEELTGMAESEVDLVLIDLDMPGMNGVESLALFREAHPDVKIAVLTGTEERSIILECLSAGVHGYILKADATTELASAIQVIVSGGIYVPARLSRLVVKQPPTQGNDVTHPDLTRRQREVMALLAKGLSTKSIARQMTLGVGTVKVHLSALYRTLNVHTRMEAIVKARSLRDSE